MSHPLRGALFETWVYSELLKGRSNRGLASNIHFWRDRLDGVQDVVPIDRVANQSGTAPASTRSRRWTESPRRVTTSTRSRRLSAGDSVLDSSVAASCDPPASKSSSRHGRPSLRTDPPPRAGRWPSFQVLRPRRRDPYDRAWKQASPSRRSVAARHGLGARDKCSSERARAGGDPP